EPARYGAAPRRSRARNTGSSSALSRRRAASRDRYRRTGIPSIRSWTPPRPELRNARGALSRFLITGYWRRLFPSRVRRALQPRKPTRRAMARPRRAKVSTAGATRRAKGAAAMLEQVRRLQPLFAGEPPARLDNGPADLGVLSRIDLALA